MTSMSAGCSRSTTFLHNTDNLAHLPPFRGDYSFDSRRSVDIDPYPLQPPAERDYDQKQNLSPARFAHSTGLVSPDPYSGAMSTSEGRSMSQLFRSQHFHEVWEKLDPGNVETRPPHPYTELIKLCILKRREGKLTLNQLYHDLEAKFPHFAASPKGAGWKVSTTTLPSTLYHFQSADATLFVSHRTRFDTTSPLSHTSSSWNESTVSWARVTTGRTVLISKSPLHWLRAPSSSSHPCGHHR